VRGHPQASNRSDVQDVHNIELIACEQEAHATSAPPQHRRLRWNCHDVATLHRSTSIYGARERARTTRCSPCIFYCPLTMFRVGQCPPLTLTLTQWLSPSGSHAAGTRTVFTSTSTSKDAYYHTNPTMVRINNPPDVDPGIPTLNCTEAPLAQAFPAEWMFWRERAQLTVASSVGAQARP
jgi:hypothetical protein